MTKHRSIIIFLSAVLFCSALGGCRTAEQKYAAFMQSGKKRLEEKDYSRAVLDFKNAVNLRQKDPEAYYQLALAYLSLRDFKNAVACLIKATEIDPKHAAAQLKLAELMTTSRNRGDLEEAEKRIEQILAHSPSDPEVLNALGIAEWRLGKPQEAEEHLMQALEKAPQNIRAALNIVRIKIAEKNLPEAEALLKKIAVANPKSADAPVLLAQFYLVTRRPTEAEQQFRRALAVDPKKGSALMGLADMAYHAKRFDEAEPLYRRAAALPDSEYKPAHATFLFRTGKRDESIREFEDLATQNPSDRFLRNLLIAAYQEVGRTADVEKTLQAALQKNPKDLDALLQRSRLYLIAGKFSEAQADLAAVIRLQPDSAEAHYLLAKIHQARGAVLNQRQELGEAIRIKPSFLLARVDLAQLLIGTNAPKSALDLLNEAPPSQKNVLSVVLYQSWAQLALGNKAEARRGINQALSAARTREVLLLDATFRLADHDSAGARKSAEEVLKQHPEDVGALDLLVQSYAAENQINAAVQAVKKYAGERPKSAPAQHYLGLVFLRVGDRVQARSAFTAAKLANPRYVPSSLALAQMNFADGKLDEARKALTEIAAANPHNPQAELSLGLVEEASKNYLEAVAHYRKAVELDERNATALNNLAYLLAEYGGQPDEALKFAEKASELAPDDGSVQDTLGWVLYRKGMYSSAVRHLELAESKRPNSTVKLHLGSVYVKLGDRTRGLQMLQAAMTMDPKIAESKSFQEIISSPGAK